MQSIDFVWFLSIGFCVKYSWRCILLAVRKINEDMNSRCKRLNGMVLVLRFLRQTFLMMHSGCWSNQKWNLFKIYLPWLEIAGYKKERRMNSKCNKSYGWLKFWYEDGINVFTQGCDHTRTLTRSSKQRSCIFECSYIKDNCTSKYKTNPLQHLTKTGLRFF